MSCFIMTPDALRKIAFTLADILDACHFGHILTIDVNAAQISDLPKAFALKFSPIRGHNGEGIAEDLHRLNQRAYNGRYPSSNDYDFLPLPTAPRTHSIRFRPCFDTANDKPQPWHFHLVKLLDCYLYQTDEDATRNDPLRKALEAFNIALMGEIVRHTAAYTAGNWGE